MSNIQQTIPIPALMLWSIMLGNMMELVGNEDATWIAEITIGDYLRLLDYRTAVAGNSDGFKNHHDLQRVASESNFSGKHVPT